MPANLSPEYKRAQERYRQARDPHERLEHLREMLSVIPKHKGTDHLQADLKRAIKELTEELAGPRKGGARGGPALAVHHEGAAQVALLGPPNSGKSQLHARLTHSHAQVGPFPRTTHLPLPGMLPVEDIHLQLVDLPPVAADHVDPWLPGALQTADGALLVVDLGDPDCLGEVAALRRLLAERRIHLCAAAGRPGADAATETLVTTVSKPATGADAGTSSGDHDEDADPFRRDLTTLLVANKADLLAEPGAELATFRELAGLPFRALAVSAETGAGLDRLGSELCDLLGVVRVYTKVPGHPPDLGRPFTVRRGDRVRDVATLVHRGMAEHLHFARVWGASAAFAGQQVSGEHLVADRDVVELHF